MLKQIICSAKLTQPLLAAASPPQEAERSGKRWFGGGSPRLSSQALRRRSRAQREAGVLRSVQRSTASAATTRSASQGVHACICFQRSAYIVRSAAQRAVLHSAQCCTARRATQRTALHSAHHFTAPSASLRTALYSAQHCTAPSTTLHRAQRAKTTPNAATTACAKGFVTCSLFD